MDVVRSVPYQSSWCVHRVMVGNYKTGFISIISMCTQSKVRNYETGFISIIWCVHRVMVGNYETDFISIISMCTQINGRELWKGLYINHLDVYTE